ncbi:hypothetical protein Mucpa_3067 [Mucilaginibacter paludis DSM 18603]|uniref:Uncharacterized protein n=1 Tax=Mucilaginibacter paludis DSM 18603 TaxID=714943 RepID=H1YED7_9SPHI|nr:hypothetical protein Mucpa_3067 [Mucilaginibacter paludis DSM 18603]
MHSLKLIGRFYQDIFLANFLVTLSCIGLAFFYDNLAHKIFPMLFWFKVVALFMIFYLAIHNKKRELYYYQNLGISKQKLLVATSVFDMIVSFSLFITAYHFK